jgi:3-demethoxyubiquinol 3-hydroxylase
LHQQLLYLERKNDKAALAAVRSILDDEENHRDIGLSEGGTNPLYAPFRFMIGAFTETVIRFGMR